MNNIQFAQTTIVDELGSVTYKGKIVNIKKDKKTKIEMVELDCTGYDELMTTIVAPVDQVVLLSEEPSKVNKTTREVSDEETTTSKEKSTAPKGNKGPSEKLQKVIDIIKNNPNKKRKEYIQMVVDQVGMTEAGASTYIHNAKAYL